jgi:protease I
MRDLELRGVRVAFLCAKEGTERIELEQPWEAVTRFGARAELVSSEAGNIQLFDHLHAHGSAAVDKTLYESSAADYDLLVLPGGVANPDQLRMNEMAVDFVRGFFELSKPVAAICHAPWLLIEAGVVDERTLTSWPSLRTDLINAGAYWVDEGVHVDELDGQVLITSRKPDDLRAFCAAVVEHCAEAGAEA